MTLPSRDDVPEVVDHLTDVWTDSDALHAQAVYLDKLPLYRAVRGARFVHGVHEMVANGDDPGPDSLDKRHHDLLSTFQEPIELGEDAGAGWQEIDLSRNPYHAYLYAVGSIGALSITRELRDGELAASDYRDMLRRGRSVTPTDVFSPVLDFTEDSTIGLGIKAYANRVDRLLAEVDRPQ